MLVWVRWKNTRDSEESEMELGWLGGYMAVSDDAELKNMYNAARCEQDGTYTNLMGMSKKAFRGRALSFVMAHMPPSIFYLPPIHDPAPPGLWQLGLSWRRVSE